MNAGVVDGATVMRELFKRLKSEGVLYGRTAGRSFQLQMASEKEDETEVSIIRK